MAGWRNVNLIWRLPYYYFRRDYWHIHFLALGRQINTLSSYDHVNRHLVFAGYLYVSLHFGFHASWWQEYPSMRHRMVHSLVESNQLVGLKKSEVITILGPADDSLDNTIIYYTYRPALIFSLDQDALVIGFQNGIVPAIHY